MIYFYIILFKRSNHICDIQSKIMSIEYVISKTLHLYLHFVNEQFNCLKVIYLCHICDVNCGRLDSSIE